MKGHLLARMLDVVFELKQRVISRVMYNVFIVQLNHLLVPSVTTKRLKRPVSSATCFVTLVEDISNTAIRSVQNYSRVRQT